MLGVSYGAATAIFAARDLGLQVGGVVAMESFDNAGAAIRAMVPHMLARAPERWSDYLALPLARWRYGGQNLDAAIAGADRSLGLDLDRVDVGAALAQVPGCVLLIHGRDDAHVPVAQGRVRASQRGGADRIEAERDEFFERVRNAYRARARAEPRRFRVIDASLPAADVLAAAVTAIDALRAGAPA